MAKILLMIGTGGFLGSIARYLSQLFIQRNYPTSFPFGTLWVNIVGCLILGLVYGLVEKGNLLSPEWRLFLATGICGGFTTFSAFSFENFQFIREGQILYAALYIGSSVVTGILATWLGFALIKMV